jgi:hypothetical protein
VKSVLLLVFVLSAPVAFGGTSASGAAAPDAGVIALIISGACFVAAARFRRRDD